MQEKHDGSLDARISRVLNGLRPPVAIKGRPAVRWTLQERMETLHVPGVSIAIVDGGQLVWAGGFGVKESGNKEPITASTLFQAASISKPVAATAVLRLVEAGAVSLDEDVNSYLKSWKVPENNYTLQEKVTFRRILSHTAGFTVHGFPGYRLGDSIPSLNQILDGEQPSNSPPVRVDILPGSTYRYSGGGFSVMQKLLADVTGEPFPTLMKRLVFEPAGMSLSTYDQPLPEPRHKEASSGHDAEGLTISGHWHVYPEMAAAGLWTTPSELAKWGIEVTNAWKGDSNKVLSRESAVQMLTLQQPPFPMGLGVVLGGTGSAISFSHGGGNQGFRAYFVMYPSLGKGAAVMTNANQGAVLYDEVIRSIATEFDWPAGSQSIREVVKLSAAQMDGLVGIYKTSNSKVSCIVRREGDRLLAELTGHPPERELGAVNADNFFTNDGATVQFSRDNSGRGVKMKVGNAELART